MIEIIDCIQGSEEWLYARLGIPSASHFAEVMAGGRDGATSITRGVYMRKLAGEIICQRPREHDYKSAAMERGAVMEPELRSLYALMTNNEPQQVGFIKRKFHKGYIGCSPDSLVGEDGLVEYKSMAPHLLIELLQGDRTPIEHLPQVQGSLFVTERKWADLFIGYTGMPPFLRRIRRDEAYIARLKLGLEVFQDELFELVAWIGNYGKKQ